MSQKLDCTACGLNPCSMGGPNESLKECPMVSQETTLSGALKRYETDDGLRQMAIAAAKVEGLGYMKWTRVEDTMEFARAMGYTTLGIACCIGLKREGAILESVLKRNGFTVVSAICKTGGIAKERIGVKDEEKINPGSFEAMCNPVAQAMLLDSAGSQLSIVVGLCVGHDSIFYRSSKAPVTTLIAKDRVLGHNPVQALYNHLSYYKERLYENHRGRNQDQL